MMRMADGKLGFEEKEITQLERVLGITFLDKGKDPYPYYLGEYIEIICSGGPHEVGVYRGTDGLNLILLPCLISETYPEIRGEGVQESDKHTFYWETKRPVSLRYDTIISICPVSKDYVDGRIQKSNLILEHFIPKIIVPSERDYKEIVKASRKTLKQ